MLVSIEFEQTKGGESGIEFSLGNGVVKALARFTPRCSHVDNGYASFRRGALALAADPIPNLGGGAWKWDDLDAWG